MDMNEELREELDDILDEIGSVNDSVDTVEMDQLLDDLQLDDDPDFGQYLDLIDKSILELKKGINDYEMKLDSLRRFLMSGA